VLLHNAKPVDAALVKKNLDAQKDSKLTGEALSFVSTITAPDNLTVVVKMNKPWSTFPHTLTAQVGAIAAGEMIDAGGEGNKAPVGSGPFIFDQWTPGKNLTVHQNPNYWRKGYPYLDAIEFQVLPDIQARGASLSSGSVNIFETNDANQILSFTDKAKNEPDSGVQIFTDQKVDGSKIFVGLNTSKPPFDDLLARQAVAYSGNVVQLSEQAYHGVFPPAYGPFSQNSPYFKKSDDYPTYDPVKGKQLADEYEKKHGKKLEFTANIIPVPEVTQVAQVLQQQLAEVGITVHLNSQEQAKLIIDALTGNYEATGFILFGSPHLDREYVFISSPPRKNGELSLNFTRLGINADGTKNSDNDKIIAAMDKARTTDDFEKQKEQYAIVQAEMAKNLNFLFLVQQTSAIVYDKNLRGAKVYALPDPSGGNGKAGLPTTQTFTFNLWIAK
jgi:peptide/nickel transport system substrate-binding protein